MKLRTLMACLVVALLFLSPKAGWSFTDDQMISVDMGWFQLKKLDMSQFKLLEVQLGGVKLGDTIYNYLGQRDGHAPWTGVAKYYGNPTGLVVAGAASPAAAAGAGAAPSAPLPAGAPFAAPLAAPAGYPGASPGAAPGGAGMAAPGSAGVGSALSAARTAARGGVSGYQLPPIIPLPSALALESPPEQMGTPSMAVRPATFAFQAPGEAGGAVRSGLQANDEEHFPAWATPVWFSLQPGEVEYVYHKTPDLVIGVVVNEVGIVTAVAVAGAPTNFAKTSLGRAHRYVKLGDLFKMCLYRYGYPDKIQTFDASGGGGQVVQFNVTTNVVDNDCILWYDEEMETGLHRNIAFTCHDMKVTRIHIWIPQEEE